MLEESQVPAAMQVQFQGDSREKPLPLRLLSNFTIYRGTVDHADCVDIATVLSGEALYSIASDTTFSSFSTSFTDSHAALP